MALFCRTFQPAGGGRRIGRTRKAEVKGTAQPILGQPPATAGRLVEQRQGSHRIGINAVTAQQTEGAPGRPPQIAAESGPGEKPGGFGKVAWQPDPVIQQPAQYRLAGRTTLFGAAGRLLQGLAGGLRDTFADGVPPAVLGLGIGIAAAGHAFELGERALAPEIVGRTEQFQCATGAALDQAAVQRLAEELDQRGGRERNEGVGHGVERRHDSLTDRRFHQNRNTSLLIHKICG